MATNLLLLADTHIPTKAKRLPEAVLEAVDAADIVVHAGDWMDLDTYELLQSRARVMHGVYGNNDGPELRAVLPEVAYFTVERSEEHTSELQSRFDLVCRLLLEKKKRNEYTNSQNKSYRRNDKKRT